MSRYRYVDLAHMFPRTKCELSRIFNETVRRICRSKGHLMQLSHSYLTLTKIEEFARAIDDKGSPYKSCFGFIDGTVRAICRPNNNQRNVILWNYNCCHTCLYGSQTTEFFAVDPPTLEEYLNG